MQKFNVYKLNEKIIFHSQLLIGAIYTIFHSQSLIETIFIFLDSTFLNG